jgi:hypothetical protein
VRSLENSSGIAMGYGLYGPCSILGSEFSLLYSVQTDCVAYPASYPVGTRGFYPEHVKQHSYMADQSPPSAYTYITFMASVQSNLEMFGTCLFKCKSVSLPVKQIYVGTK